MPSDTDMSSLNSSTTTSRTPSPLQLEHPLAEGHIRVWKKGRPPPYQKASPESVKAPKTIRVWQLAKEKFRDPQEVSVRNALASISGIQQEGLDAELLFHIINNPPELILYQYTKNEDSSTFDPNYPSKIFSSYRLSQALENTEDNSEKETCLLFFTLISHMHEIVHWLLYQEQIKSTQRFGFWHGHHIKDYSSKAESGYAFEGHLYGGVIRYMGCLPPDSTHLFSQENGKLTVDKVTNLALAGPNPKLRDRRIIANDAMKTRMEGLLTNFDPGEVEFLRFLPYTGGYSRENVERNTPGMGEERQLRRSKRLKGMTV